MLSVNAKAGADALSEPPKAKPLDIKNDAGMHSRGSHHYDSFFEGAEPDLKLFNDLLKKHKSKRSILLGSRYACGIMKSNTKPYILVWSSVR